MEKLVKELKSVSSPDKFGLILATLIIIFSFFSTRLDNILAFVFGISMFSIFTGMSLNRTVRTDERIEGNIKNTYSEDILYFTRYPTVSKVFFWIGGILFLVFVVRLILILIR